MATVARVGLNKFSIHAGPLSTTGHAFWQSTPAAPAKAAMPQAASPLDMPAQAVTPQAESARGVPSQVPSAQGTSPQTASPQAAPAKATPSQIAPAQATLSEKTSPQGSSWLSGPLDVDLQVNIAPAKSAPATATQAAVPTARQAGTQAAAQAPAQAAGHTTSQATAQNTGQATAKAAATEESADPLDMLAAPATVRLTAAGPLAAPDLALLRECAAYTAKTKRHITFEYTLVKGFNDSRGDAEELAGRLRRFPCRVNLIPLSPVEEFAGEAPPRAAMEAFLQVLERNGVEGTLRDSKGKGVDAACGQLRRRSING